MDPEIESGIATAPEGEQQVEAVNNAPEQATGEVEQAKPNAEVPEWAKKRFGELTAKRHEAERRAAEAAETARQLQARLEAMQSGEQQTSQPLQGDIRTLAQQIAEQDRAVERFNNRCNEVAAQGKKEIADFDSSLQNLNQYFGLSTEFLAVATEVDGVHRALWYLGKPENFDEFERISKMTPARMASELTKLTQTASKALQKPVSKAPEPVEPIGGKGSAEGIPDPSDTKAWIAYRNQHAKRRR